MPMSSTRVFALGLIILALVCVLGLDYIQWRQGESAWIFGPRPTQIPSGWIEQTLSDIVKEQVLAMGLSPDVISQYRDSEGIQHMLLEATPEQYRNLESRLDREFSRINATATKKEREQSEGKVYILWRIQDQSNQLLSLLVSFREEMAEAEKTPGPIPPRMAVNKVAIIIDDMGNSLESIEEVCRLKRPITVAVLPYSSLSRETATIARRNNLEVILHLPLESLFNEYDNNHTPGIIHSAMSPEDIIDTLEESLSQVPFIDGVNTHMGSKITSDPDIIRLILTQLKGRGLYFIDSRTTAQSVAFDVAQRMGIPTAYRNVFLDSEINEDFIRDQLIRLFEYARQNGRAVGICHPSPETLKVLKEYFPLVDRYGLQPVFASEIVQ